MIVHSDSDLGVLLTILLTLAAGIAFLTSVVMAWDGKLRSAAKVAGGTLAAILGWILIVTSISFISPQMIVNIGDTYCEDIRCIGIDEVHAESRGSETIYKLDAHLFSDANTVKVSFGNVSFNLVDEQGRRFPMIPSNDNSPSAPYDTYIEPKQSIKTSLTFAAASDAKRLFLIETPRPVIEGGNKPSVGKNPPEWAKPVMPLIGAWFYLASLGNDASPFHKQTMLRVL
jgi:hypothetical protein